MIVRSRSVLVVALFAASGWPAAHGAACTASASTLGDARSLYVDRCAPIPRVDCDPVGGGWTCSSERIGSASLRPSPTSSLPPPVDPVPAPAVPTPTPAPATPVIVAPDPAPVPAPIVIRSGQRESSVVKVPLLLDNSYKYNVAAITNMWTDTFPGGVPTQLVTFYDQRRRVHIAAREFPHGEFAKPIDIDAKVHPGDTLEPDSHNTTGVAVAPDGTVFVTANHHVDELNLARTARPYDLTSFVNVPASELGRGIVERITYPSFFKLGGYLWLSAREQDVGGGTNYFMWHFWRYDHATGKWDIRTRVNGGQRLRLYLSNVDWSADESRIHFHGVWRDEQFRTGLSQNTDLFYLTSRDGVRFEHMNGTSAPVPVVLDRNRNGATRNDHEVSVKIWDTSRGDPQPYQKGRVVYDTAGVPHMLIKEMAGGSRDTWYHRWDAGRRAWTSRKTGMATHTDDIVALPDGRVGMIGHAGDSIYYLDLTTPGARRVLLSRGWHTRDFQVNIGKTEARAGYLSIWLTENGHALPGRASGRKVTEARVLTIALDALDGFDRPVVR